MKPTLAHVIKMECKECLGTKYTGGRKDGNEYYEINDCPYCTEGKREYMIFKATGKPPEKKIHWEGFLEEQDFWEGETVNTSEGERVAGEVSLKQWLSDSDWLEFHHHKELSYALKVLPDYAGGTTYLCIAEANPA